MKKISILFLLLCLSVISIAQNIQLSHNGVIVNNNDTIIINSDTTNYLLTADVRTSNIGTSALDVSITRTDISIVAGANFNFCWDQCYAPSVTQSPVPVTIPSNGFTDQFKGDYTHNYNLGTSVVKYKIYDGNNPADGVSFFIKYKVTSAISNINSITEKNKMSYTFNNNFFKLLNANNSLNSVYVYNVNGKLVKASNKTEIDLSNLSSNTYIVLCDTKNGLYKYKIIKE